MRSYASRDLCKAGGPHRCCFKATHVKRVSASRYVSVYFIKHYIPPFFMFLCFEPKVIALFQEKFGRRPLPNDTYEFSAVLKGALEKNGLPLDFLGEGADAAAAVCATAAAEVSPVCAILGGVLGQEVGDGTLCACANEGILA